jgi:hypothetical protein
VYQIIEITNQEGCFCDEGAAAEASDGKSGERGFAQRSCGTSRSLSQEEVFAHGQLD